MPQSDSQRTLKELSYNEHRLASMSTEISALEQRILRAAVGGVVAVATLGLAAARLMV